MKAMIRAAGLGERMRPLTNEIPKPLIEVNDRYLIEYSLQALARADYKEVIINLHHLADQIKSALGDGKRYGLNIHYSEETELLGTGGGVFNALPLLGKEPFLILSCDVITDYPLQNLPKKIPGLAHLVMIDNSPDHSNGDFHLENNKISLTKGKKLTYANIGIYHPYIFKDCQSGNFSVTPLLIKAIQNNQVTGEYFQGEWINISSAKDLKTASKTVSSCV